MRLGYLVMSSRAVPWHMQYVNITWWRWLCLWKRLSQCIPYSNAFWNSSVVFLFGNPGGFVCCILYRVQLSRQKYILLEEEFYFRKWLLNWINSKITSKRSHFINFSAFLITCLVVTNRSQPRSPGRLYKRMWWWRCYSRCLISLRRSQGFGVSYIRIGCTLFRKTNKQFINLKRVHHSLKIILVLKKIMHAYDMKGYPLKMSPFLPVPCQPACLQRGNYYCHSIISFSCILPEVFYPPFSSLSHRWEHTVCT